MRKLIELPVPQLSLLKKVHLDMDMSGKHLELLIKSGETDPDGVVNSILTDLVEEDASLLSRPEASFLFHLVKIYNLQDKIFVHVKCKCGCENSVELNFAKATYNVPDKKFKVPKVNWTMFGETKEYFVYPMTFSREIAIKDWYMTVRDKTIEQAENDKELDYEITAIRALSSLVDNQGNHVFEAKDFDKAVEIFRENNFINIRKLLTSHTLVGSFGPQLSAMRITCKECKKTVTFRVPPLVGLVS